MTLAPTWRRGRDSNPRAVARKLISSRCRYPDFGRRQEIMTEITGA